MEETFTKKSLDNDIIEKKFIGAKNTQDCIQSVALWALTHKNQHDQIVAIWLSSVKKSKVSRRLTLFYICNEIVQTCRRKHALIFKDAFKQVLKDATLLVRDKTVCDGIERMFNIWKERDIFEEDFISELLKLLKDSNIESSGTMLLSDFKLNDFVDGLRSIWQQDEEVLSKTKKMQNINIDSLNFNFTKLLKDRQQGFIYTHQAEECYKQLSEFVSKCEKLNKKKEEFANDLDFCALYYEAQYSEARIVANAYKSFGNRIRTIQRKLEELRKTLPDPLSPIPSPTLDAPSPPDSINDCMSPLSDAPLPGNPPLPEDNTEPVDMEFSDEEDNKSNSLSTMNTIQSKPAIVGNTLSIDIKTSPQQTSNSILNGVQILSSLKSDRNNIKDLISNSLEVVDLTNDDKNDVTIKKDSTEINTKSSSSIFKSLQMLAQSMKVPLRINSPIETTNSISVKPLQYDSKSYNHFVNSQVSNKISENNEDNKEQENLLSGELYSLDNKPQTIQEDSSITSADSSYWKSIKLDDDIYDDDDDTYDENKMIRLVASRRNAYALSNQNEEEIHNISNIESCPKSINQQMQMARDLMTNSSAHTDSEEQIPQINAEMIDRIIENISNSSMFNPKTSDSIDYIETIDLDKNYCNSEDGELTDENEGSFTKYQKLDDPVIDYEHGESYQSSSSYNINQDYQNQNNPTCDALPMPPPPPFFLNNNSTQEINIRLMNPPQMPRFQEIRTHIMPNISQTRNLEPSNPRIFDKNTDFYANASPINERITTRLMSPKEFQCRMLSSPPPNSISPNFPQAPLNNPRLDEFRNNEINPRQNLINTAQHEQVDPCFSFLHRKRPPLLQENQFICQNASTPIVHSNAPNNELNMLRAHSEHISNSRFEAFNTSFKQSAIPQRPHNIRNSSQRLGLRLAFTSKDANFRHLKSPTLKDSISYINRPELVRPTRHILSPNIIQEGTFLNDNINLLEPRFIGQYSRFPQGN